MSSTGTFCPVVSVDLYRDDSLKMFHLTDEALVGLLCECEVLESVDRGNFIAHVVMDTEAQCKGIVLANSLSDAHMLLCHEEFTRYRAKRSELTVVN